MSGVTQWENGAPHLRSLTPGRVRNHICFSSSETEVLWGPASIQKPVGWGEDNLGLVTWRPPRQRPRYFPLHSTMSTNFRANSSPKFAKAFCCSVRASSHPHTPSQDLSPAPRELSLSSSSAPVCLSDPRSIPSNPTALLFCHGFPGAQPISSVGFLPLIFGLSPHFSKSPQSPSIWMPAPSLTDPLSSPHS